MGPITLFDKSFIQSLSLDESVWFDHFFLTNVCPLFYVETLADLEKPVTRKKSQEDEVRIIANKFPAMNSGPSAHHSDLCLSNLLGYEIPMRGQILLDSGRVVLIGGKPNVISEGSPVSEAFDRWQRSEFSSVERKYASQWRQQLSQIDLREYPEILKSWKQFDVNCSSLEQVKILATEFVISEKVPYLRMEICIRLLQVPKREEYKIRDRWAGLNYPSIYEFAPYAAFLLSVIIFFYICMQFHLISSKRPSNLVDIAYLFYLPFCMLFVSSDRLHQEVAPLFLRNNQEFVWGHDLKSSLREINLFFSLYPNSEKNRGINAFAPTPPQQITTLVSQLWDRYLPSWRQSEDKQQLTHETPKLADLSEKVRRMRESPTLIPHPDQFRIDEIQSTTIMRSIRKKKGTWYQIPKDWNHNRDED